MLRPLRLPENIPGKVYLTHMPGYYEIDGSPADSYEAMINASVSGIVCLNSLAELAEKSPIYASDHRIPDALPAPLYNFPITDLGVPNDVHAFNDFVQKLCENLKRGHILAIHCALGIGRTGLTAACILMNLGIPLEEAQQRVFEAQSSAESYEQEKFLRRYATLLKEKP